MTDVCVLGLGHVGLPTAALLADRGHTVLGVDTNGELVERLGRGEVVGHVEDVCRLVRDTLQAGSLRVSVEPECADVYLITVPTPVTADKQPDLSCVKAAARSLLPLLRPGVLVCLESTVPLLTTRDLLAPILAESGLELGRELFVAHAPERIRPESVLTDLEFSDRVVGGLDQESGRRAAEFYRRFITGETHITTAAGAELGKLMENAERDVRIAVANEMARIAEQCGVDIWETVELCNKHPRVNLLVPGPGVGGHCVAVDPWFLIRQLPDSTKLLQAARAVNDEMPAHTARLVLDMLPAPNDSTVVILGITYKANVRDDRESPGHAVAEHLRAAGCTVRLHDPHRLPEVELDEAVREADCVVLMVAHDAYRDLDPQRIGSLMRKRRVLDTRGVLDRARWQTAGFEVRALGVGEG